MNDTILCLSGAALSIFALVVANLFPSLWVTALVIASIGLAMTFIGIRCTTTRYI